jgi:hypothetical protein
VFDSSVMDSTQATNITEPDVGVVTAVTALPVPRQVRLTREQARQVCCHDEALGVEPRSLDANRVMFTTTEGGNPTTPPRPGQLQAMHGSDRRASRTSADATSAASAAEQRCPRTSHNRFSRPIPKAIAQCTGAKDQLRIWVTRREQHQRRG